jgi:lipoyl-dependent peroxiredoxin
LEALYTAAAEVEGGRGGQATGIEGAPLTLAFPPELGGCGAGTNPEQLLAVAFGASFGSALDLEARQIGCVLQPLRVEALVSLTHGVDGCYAMALELRCHLPSLPRDVAERLLRAARDACPCCRMVRDNVELRVLLAGPDST